MNDGYIASIDIGTTAVKGLLIDRAGNPHGEISVPLETMRNERGWIEQDPEDWWSAVVRIGRAWKQSGHAASIRCLAFSGQMQDLIATDAEGRALRPAILYSDGRAGLEAREVKERLSEADIRAVTGNHFDGTFPLAKILWLRRHEPDVFRKARWFLFGSKDPVILRLTGRAVADPTTGATTGLMDIRARQWAEKWLDALDLSAGVLPDIVAPREAAGSVQPGAAEETGFPAGIPVLAGVGDAGASTLGAGVMSEGELYTYLGTTGWVAAYVREPVQAVSGLFHLAHPGDGGFIATAPVFSAGGVHRWAVGALASGPDDYAGFERLAAASRRERNPVLFLPYLGGERCPVQDPGATGVFLGLTMNVSKEDLAAAALEGLSMAIRQVRDLLLPDGRPDEMTVVGGGGRSAMWMQILADVTGTSILVPANAQFLPALGAASLGFVHLGWSADFARFRSDILRNAAAERRTPNPALSAHYGAKYAKYCRIYETVKPLM